MLLLLLGRFGKKEAGQVFYCPLRRLLPLEPPIDLYGYEILVIDAFQGLEYRGKIGVAASKGAAVALTEMHVPDFLPEVEDGSDRRSLLDVHMERVDHRSDG